MMRSKIGFVIWLIVLAWGVLGAIANASQSNLELFLGFSLFGFVGFTGLISTVLK